MGLTIAQGFESWALKNKEARLLQKEESKDLSVYEGRVPIHQRLILLCYDFLESTQSFDINDLFNFQGNMFGQEKHIEKKKLKNLERIVKELF